MGIGNHVQVLPRTRRLQIRLRRAPATALEDIETIVADALLTIAVEVGRVWQTDALGGTEDGLRQFVLHRIWRNFQSLGALGSLEVRQDVFPTPTGAPASPPAVIVVAVAANVDHPVDRTRPAQDLAAGLVH